MKLTSYSSVAYVMVWLAIRMYPGVATRSLLAGAYCLLLLHFGEDL